MTVKSLRSGKVILLIILLLFLITSLTRFLPIDFWQHNERNSKKYGRLGNNKFSMGVRKTTLSERIPAEQVYTSLANSLSELQKLRDNSNMPQVLLDLWESKFNRWLSNLSTTTEEV